MFRKQRVVRNIGMKKNDVMLLTSRPHMGHILPPYLHENSLSFFKQYYPTDQPLNMHHYSRISGRHWYLYKYLSTLSRIDLRVFGNFLEGNFFLSIRQTLAVEEAARLTHDQFIEDVFLVQLSLFGTRYMTYQVILLALNGVFNILLKLRFLEATG